MNHPNEELVRQAIGGDYQAFSLLLEQVGPAIRSALAGRIPPRWQSVLSADDIMQQTYADALVDISRFAWRGPESFVAWLKTLAERNLLDAIKMLEAQNRGGDRRRVQADDESFLALYEMVEGTTTSPSRQAVRREVRGLIEAALQRLPDAYRRVVCMYDLEGCGAREVAEALGRSEGAVYMLRARAHARLKGQLGTSAGFFSGSA